MRSFKRALWVVLVNVLIVIVPIGVLELYFRSQPAGAAPPSNALWQRFQPYVMFTTVPGDYLQWFDEFTQKLIAANVRTNSLGFNDSREFDFTAPYQRAPGEKIVLFTGGSAGWGVGATGTDKTIAARMQYHLNTLQQRDRYTVVNLAMGSWIAVQQLVGLQLWGARFDPDWVVVMDGFNDAAVGCAHSQGVGNPMYSAAMRSLVHGYMFSSAHPDFYRGWLENQIIKYSSAYRALTGKQYIPFDATFDAGSMEVVSARRQIIPVKVGAAREMLAFYLAAEAATLRLFPDAKYIFSTQPTVNVFRGDFVDIYDHPSGSPERQQAIAKREAELEVYLQSHENEACGVKAQGPSFTYVFGNGAVRLERWAAEQMQHGRHVEYHNLGTLLPNEREERKPFFIDPAHLSDRGQEIIGRFFAEKILKAQ
jgi:hypothetical protein